MTYRIHYYAGETLQGSGQARTAKRILQEAYAYIGANPLRVAHIWKAHTTEGLYIARATDTEQTTEAQRVALLKQKWSAQ